MQASRHPLHSLLWPQSVAIIGASPDVGKIRGRLMSFLAVNGFAGEILPINPSHREILGHRCYPDIAAVGRPVDVALVAIPAATVLPELERCAAAGVRHAVIISSGFAEEGGDSARIQDEIGALARRTGMRVSGPNAEGYYNAALSLAATFSPTLQEKPQPGPRLSGQRVGIVAQSGGVGFALYQQGLRAGLDFSYVVTSGNEADLTMADYVEYMVDDEITQVIFLYCETLRDPRRFERAALRARERGKSIVAIKIGQSGSGQRAAASHTASMAGWNVAYDALFERCGVAQPLDLEEAITMAGLLVSGPVPAGARVAVISASGGAAAWAGDTIERLGGSVPELSAALQDRIRPMLPSYGSAANPIDVTAQGSRSGALVRIADMLSTSDEVDAILIVTSLTIKHFVLDAGELARIAAARRKPVLFYSFTLPTELAMATLTQAGILVTTNLPGTAAALVKLARPFSPQHYARRDAAAAPSARALAVLGEASSLLCEYEVKRVLQEFDLKASTEQLATSADEAVAAAEVMGWPVALKVQSPQLPHKTEIGGVRLNVASAAEVRAGYEALVAAAARHSDPAQLRGILVQRMAPRGHEIIIGTLRDPEFGPLVSVGFGGVAVELYRDVVYRQAPVTPEGARAMIEGLRARALLQGFRGAAPVDVTPLAELVAAVSRIAWSLRDQVDEFELNPVIVHADGSGLTIADALMRQRPAKDCR